MYLKEAYLLAKNNNLKWYKSLVNIMKSTDLDQMHDHLTIHPNLLVYVTGPEKTGLIYM